MPSRAATFTSLGDNASDPTTLRGAIASSELSTDTNDTINITATGTITLGGTEIGIYNGENVTGKTLTINGPGESSLSVSSNAASRIFDNYNNGTGDITVNITGLTVTDGNVSSSTAEFYFGGGGIWLQSNQTLSLSSCSISNNTAILLADPYSEPFATGGGVFDQGNLNMVAGAGSLSPFVGYWIYALVPCTITVPEPV
jgi:hypothetical protein